MSWFKKKEKIKAKTKTKLIKFLCGAYGVQIGESKFIDLKDPYYSWEPGTRSFNDCKGTEEEARKIFELKDRVIAEVIEVKP